MNATRVVCLWLVLAGLVLAGSGVSTAGISISIQPSNTCVCEDENFTVFIFKDSLDVDFDGYQAVITFDPEKLELVSMAEEYVMTDSCGNRWWFLDAGEDSIFISHVLMCGGISVTGPGALSSMTFRALQQGPAVISCDYFWLTYQGYWLKDVDWHDGVFEVGQVGIEGKSGLEDGSLRIEVSPNPGRSFRISLAGDPGVLASLEHGTLDICDVTGQVVKSIWSGRSPRLMGDSHWDGSCGNGSPVSPGVYFARFSAPAGCINRKIILTR